MTARRTTTPEDLAAALEQGNALRHPNNASSLSLRMVESVIDNIFGAGRHLAVYGSLAPGKSNHAIVQSVQGDSIDGVVRGTLHDAGWARTKVVRA